MFDEGPRDSISAAIVGVVRGLSACSGGTTMIYSGFGDMITITADHGEQYSGFHPRPVRLVSATRFDDGEPGFYLAHTMKADDGKNEIDKAIAIAPKISLSFLQVRDAMKKVC
jgi:hypothetical protein